MPRARRGRRRYHHRIVILPRSAECVKRMDLHIYPEYVVNATC
jgi:hypothetical protein